MRKGKSVTEKKEVLYCGDATLATGACYLGGVMTLAGIGFDYVEMEAPFPQRLLEKDYGLIILSDYPSGNFPAGALDRIARKVQQGTSFLMIGGWESFHGLIGNYHTSVLAPVLPVECLKEDDRINWCQGLVPEVISQHPILEGLPWDQPPMVCGCNRVKAKKEATVVLGLRKLRIESGWRSTARSTRAQRSKVCGESFRSRALRMRERKSWPPSKPPNPVAVTPQER